MKCSRPIVAAILLTAAAASHAAGQEDTLYAAFSHPPAQARPMVRWWWNGNCVTQREVLRELDVMKAAGIGGVEINPIAMPRGAAVTSDKPLDWLSPQWNRVLKCAIEGGRQRGMVVDLLAGCGWPFGGRFLDPSETVQGVGLNTRRIDGPGDFAFAVKDLLTLPERAEYQSESHAVETAVLRLVPQAPARRLPASTSRTASPNGTVAFRAASGRYTLCAGVLQDSFREVVLGPSGGRPGPRPFQAGGGR